LTTDAFTFSSVPMVASGIAAASTVERSTATRGFG
jgi:hypothetical protein